MIHANKCFSKSGVRQAAGIFECLLPDLPFLLSWCETSLSNLSRKANNSCELLKFKLNEMPLIGAPLIVFSCAGLEREHSICNLPGIS